MRPQLLSVPIEVRSLESANNCCESARVAGETACRQDWLVTYLDRIVRDPAICAGQPVIRGTRVWSASSSAISRTGTRRTTSGAFPSLAEEDVRAVIAFAAASAGEDLPVPSPIPPNAQVA
jgi:uncharacterized protein (DUF433 family)